MRDIATDLKELRLPGMVGAWADLLEQDESACTASKWLLEHLLQAEHSDRAMRSVSHQMFAAKSPYTATWPASTSLPRRWTSRSYASSPRRNLPIQRRM